MHLRALGLGLVLLGGCDGGEITVDEDTTDPDTDATEVVDVDEDGWAADEDCDDDDPARHPTAPEICNGVDDDCDTLVDQSDAPMPGTGATGPWFTDMDGDGFGDDAIPAAWWCTAPDEDVSRLAGDCDDTDADARPGGPTDCVDPEIGPADCGDGALSASEECDDGNRAGNDGCSGSCHLETCGDGRVQSHREEVCDDGNLDAGDGCGADCTFEACGDGVLQAAHAEQCDDGNLDADDGCSPTCAHESCGDGVVDAHEACDDGNAESGDGCSDVCVIEACGDGILQTPRGELCDDGNTVAGDGCAPSCVPESCGDEIVQEWETCDDGNADDDDGCSSICLEEYCGDHVVQQIEECDDGNLDANDGCDAECVTEDCGDGIVQPGIGEECDEGDEEPDDGCSATCRVEECGDGVVQADEGCDDGGTADDDGCSADCLIEASCGNAQIDGGETCDDGGNVSGDGCSEACSSELFRVRVGGWQFGKGPGTFGAWEYDFTAPDGFYRLDLDGAVIATSETRANDNTPEWTEWVEVDVPFGSTLTLYVYDDDSGSNDASGGAVAWTHADLHGLADLGAPAAFATSRVFDGVVTVERR